MNKARRKEIDILIQELNKVAEKIASMYEESGIPELLDSAMTLRDEEDESFQNMPEGLQQSERGQASEEALDNLQSAIDELEQIEETFKQTETLIEDAVNYLTEAMN